MRPGLKPVFTALCLTGCGSISAEEPAGEKTCPLYETRDWSVSIERSVSGEHPYQLRIDGIVDAPDPTYKTTFRPGPMDRRLPPAFTVFLDSKPSGEVAIQVIDSQPVSFRWDTAIGSFRAVRVVCDERVLIEFSDVEAAD